MRASISRIIVYICLSTSYILGLKAEDKAWDVLIPNLAITQYAGNIGMVSAGMGWDYGQNNHWETHILMGFLPKSEMWNDQFTATLREHYLPFELDVTKKQSFQPLMLTLSLNTIFSHEFWYTEPANNNYYRFSSKLRAHIGIGSRWNLITSRHRYSLYYELSTYDLAVISYIRSSHIRLKELFSLGIGINIRMF